MSVAKYATTSTDLRKEEIYNIDELAYHQEQLVKSLREVTYHLERAQEHISRLKQLKIPSWEV